MSSWLPGAQHPTARAPCHTLPGQAGPARACQAAGKQVGQEPAAPPGQPQASCATGTEPTETQADPKPTTWGDTALPGDSGGTSTHPRGSIPRAATGDTPSWGETPQLGDPRSVPGGTVSRGGKSLSPAGTGLHPAASRSTLARKGTLSCPHGTLGHSTGVGGFGGTHMYRDRGGVGGVGSRNQKRGPQGDSGTPVTEAGRCCGTP